MNKEKLILKFCKERGWDPNNLTTGQLLFIMKKIKG
jgi:hypothetical protein